MSADTVAARFEAQAIGAVDVLIAGTAANRPGPTVMTRNVDEFERVNAIDVVSYYRTLSCSVGEHGRTR